MPLADVRIRIPGSFCGCGLLSDMSRWVRDVFDEGQTVQAIVLVAGHLT